MFQLITLVVFIAILSFIFLGGQNHLALDKQNIMRLKMEVQSSYVTLRNGQQSYTLYTEKPLPVDSWQADIQEYVNLPRGIQGMEWSYNNNANGYYFCLSGNVNSPMVLDALYSLQETSSVGFVILNEDCGDLTNFSVTPDINTNPMISATFYLK